MTCNQSGVLLEFLSLAKIWYNLVCIVRYFHIWSYGSLTTWKILQFRVGTRHYIFFVYIGKIWYREMLVLSYHCGGGQVEGKTNMYTKNSRGEKRIEFGFLITMFWRLIIPFLMLPTSDIKCLQQCISVVYNNIVWICTFSYS